MPVRWRALIGRIVGPTRLPHDVDLACYRPEPVSAAALWRAYRLRWKRRRLLYRALRKRRELTPVADRTRRIRKGDILGFACIRNELLRLPYFLDHHRALGVSHFVLVDNGSDDGSGDFLADQPDVSLWRTDASYRDSRFGTDWLNHLLARHGSGHWCLTLDADELLDFPFSDTADLHALVRWLDRRGRENYGALMLDLYPEGPVGAPDPRAAQDPLAVLPGFDPTGYLTRVQPRTRSLWIQGGPRARAFFTETPERAPTLNKLPLVRWHWRYVYLNSTHTMLPPRMNDLHADGFGLLLHTKFLPGVRERAREECARGEHFAVAGHYADYYDAVIAGPVLWHEGSLRYEGWRQAETLGLMSRGSWDGKGESGRFTSREQTSTLSSDYPGTAEAARRPPEDEQGSWAPSSHTG